MPDFVELTDYNGAKIVLSTDGIVVQEQPVGQTQVVMPSGVVYQVQESVQEVERLLGRSTS